MAPNTDNTRPDEPGTRSVGSARDEQSVDASVGRYIGALNRELQAHTDTIEIMTELALETELTATQRGFVEATKRAAECLDELVGNIIEAAEIEQNGIKLKLGAFHLGDCLNQVLDRQRQRGLAKGVGLQLGIDNGIRLNLVGDDTRFGRVVGNLVSNAIKYSNRGLVSVHVAQTPGTASRIRVVVEVCDSGVGLADEKLTKLTVGLRGVGAKNSPGPDHLGLGLSVARDLAQAMEGEITVQSTLGGGSTFSFTAAFIEAVHREIAPAPAEEALEAPDDRPLQGVRLLLAEDDRINQQLAVRVLEKRGCSVAVAASGREAVDLASGESFDVILMDIEMPLMDGLEATRRIRQMKNNEAGMVPILAMSAHATKEHRDKCRAAGMSGFVNKPLKPAELVQAIEDVLRTRGSGSV